MKADVLILNSERFSCDITNLDYDVERTKVWVDLPSNISLVDINKPLTPLKALKHLQPLFPWANYIAFNKDFTGHSWDEDWCLYEHKPTPSDHIFRWKPKKSYYFHIPNEVVNIKYEGDWKDSLFTTIEEDTDE